MIGFWLARIFGNEEYLARMSQTTAAVEAVTQNKKIAIVGNARALSQSAFGAEIDGADMVIRINSAPLPDPVSHGTRTDWIGMSTPTAPQVIAARAPSLLMWMSPKRKRLPYAIASDPRFYLYPSAQWDRLHADLGARPTTGMMLIDFALRTKASSVTLYGFDFFSSLSLSGGRTPKDVPHDFDRERVLVERLIAQDGRLTLRK